MAIAKHPKKLQKQTDTDVAAEQFISGAEKSHNDRNPEKLVQTPVRFSPSLLKRIDAAAKRRGLGRSSWIRYAATRVLDEDGA